MGPGPRVTLLSMSQSLSDGFGAARANPPKSKGLSVDQESSSAELASGEQVEQTDPQSTVPHSVGNSVNPDVEKLSRYVAPKPSVNPTHKPGNAGIAAIMAKREADPSWRSHIGPKPLNFVTHLRRRSLHGLKAVEFFFQVAEGKSFRVSTKRWLPLSPEQIAVARGTATPEQAALAAKQKHYIVVRESYSPTVQDRERAWNWLMERGWGKVQQVVHAVDETVQGFTIVHRRWAQGVDPLDHLERTVDGKRREKQAIGPGSGTIIEVRKAPEGPTKNGT